MSLNLIFLVILSIINLLLGLTVYLKGKKGATNKSFLVLILVIIAWTVFNYLCDDPSQINNALFWNKITIAMGFIQSMAALYFVMVFPKDNSSSLSIFWKIIFIIYGIFGFLSLFTNLIVKGIEYYDWGTNIIGGNLYLFYPLLALFCMVATIYILWKKYRESKSIEKNQIGYFLVGVILYLSVMIPLSVILPFLTDSNRYAKFSPYAWVFFITFTALAITRYHLFEIKVVLTELLVGLMAIALAILPFYMPTTALKFLTIAVLCFFVIFGFLLIRATYEEIRRKEEAERLLKAKTEFLSIASHQLRTPLTAIIGYSSMLNEGDYGAIPERAKKAISRIYDSSQRMIKLVNDFLSVSRMETGKTTLKLQETSISELIREVISGLELRAKEKNLYLKYQEPNDYYLKIDPAKIKESVSNFIDNAIHYTEEGGITVSVQKNNLKTVISVSDTGAGMDTEELAKLFESFSRGSAGNELNTQGSGLGLYIAKKFVELHNGKVWAKSEGKGKGSTFCIELPNK